MSYYNYINNLNSMVSYLSQVKNNVDNWITSNNYHMYQFYIYSFIIFIILYFSSSFITFFTKLPFLLLFSLVVAYLITRG